MAAGFTLTAPLLMLLFLHTGGAVMVAAWITQLFCDTASTTLLNTYGAELFPTAQRSTATSTVIVAQTLGAALGLWMESLLFAATGSHWTAVSILTIAWFIAPIGVWLWFPKPPASNWRRSPPPPTPDGWPQNENKLCSLFCPGVSAAASVSGELTLGSLSCYKTRLCKVKNRNSD